VNNNPCGDNNLLLYYLSTIGFTCLLIHHQVFGVVAGELLIFRKGNR